MSMTIRTMSFVALLIAVASCSKSELNSDGDSSGDKPSGPVTAITAYLMAGNEGDYARAETYVSVGAQASLKRMGGIKSVLDTVTRAGTLKSIEVLSEKETDKAQVVVYLQFLFEDGRVSNGTYTLIQENGVWKIGL